MSGGGSSRPDAAAGSFPAGAPATTEPPSLAQYLALEQFPVVGDHKHSRAAELRRALGVAFAADSAEQPFALLAAEELRRIRGAVAESSARAKERVKSLQESIQKLDKYKNVVTRRRRQRSEGAPGAAEPPSLAQYLALEQFPAGGGGDHKHSRAAELRRALGVAAAADSADQPFALALAQGKPLPPAAAEELRRIRGGVAESSARATRCCTPICFYCVCALLGWLTGFEMECRERAKSLQESIHKLDKCKNVVTRRRRQRSEGAPAERCAT